MNAKKLIQSSKILSATTTALSHDGRGIASIDGKINFIEGALADEDVTFSIIRSHAKFNEGKIIDVLRASPDRIIPLCKHFDKCGSCHLQHLSITAQLQHKQNLLLEQLKRLARVAPNEILPPLHGEPWGYRRKARIGVKFDARRNSICVGFREKNSHHLTNLNSCATLDPSVGNKLQDLSQMLFSLKGREDIPQIEIAITEQSPTLVIRHLRPLSEDDQRQLIAFADTHQYQIYLQSGGPESIQLLWPKNTTDPLLTCTLSAYQLQLKFHPTDFIQINDEINNLMLKQALALIDPQSDDHILDLFCGLGNFTLPLAQKAKKVLGIECDASMVKQAQQNAALNKLDNVKFCVGDLTKEDSLQLRISEDYHKILLDPPRSGALAVVKQLAKLKKTSRILYISCNPATLARDAYELIQQGYQLKKAGIIDMFPQTYHVESIALFEK